MANIVVLLTANPAISIGVSRFVGTSYGSNTLAASLIICIPAVLSMNSRGSIWRNLAKFILFFATAFFIILTGARTALITLVIIVSVWALYLISQKWRKALPYIWAFAGVTAAIVLFNVNQLLVLLGKSPSLSGRIPLWQAYLEKIGENPLIGYGWSFQTRIDMPLGLYISQVMGVPLSNAHDDFLNWWAQTGILGAVLFLLALSSILVFGFMLRKKSEYGLWLFFTGIAFAINGLTELTTMYGDGWMVFMMSSVAVAALIYQNLQSNTVSKFLSYSVNRPEMSTFTSN
jgi:O-antigen ligase